jgi:hypothetical protein
VFFDNTMCLACGRELGFLPFQGMLSAIEPSKERAYRALVDGSLHRKCLNHVREGVCNWMVPVWDGRDYCQACRLNRVIPDLSVPENRKLWGDMEAAKRRLVYTLNRLKLPVMSKAEWPEKGLAFDIKASVGDERVMTGHADGLITLNLLEADAIEREKMRVELKERYRTLLGHFRHEIGHYYWEVLIEGTPNLAGFRGLFGDEREDYAAALHRHYKSPVLGYNERYISSYATAHPSEDWAETWAHYLHIVDTLESAHHFGFTTSIPKWVDPFEVRDFEPLIAEWLELTIALNVLNRSMGLQDAYPFSITPVVQQKLGFVHDVVVRYREATAGMPITIEGGSHQSQGLAGG